MNATPVINVRATLLAMKVGESVTLEGIRGTSLRVTASTLKELGCTFQVKKQSNSFVVTRES